MFAGVLLALVGVMAAWHYLTKIDEPSYQGKTLSEWMNPPIIFNYMAPSLRGFSPKDDAVRQMGTNAIPLLIKWLGAEDSQIKLAAAWLVNDHGSLWRKRNEDFLNSTFLLALDDKDWQVALPQITALTKHPSAAVRFRASFLLTERGKRRAAQATNSNNAVEGK